MALASQRQLLRRVLNAVNLPIGGARSLPAWLAYLIGGTFVVVLYEVVPALHVGPIFNLVALSSPIAILVGTRRNRPAAHHIWLLLAGGMALFAAGDVIAYNYSAILGVEMPFPSVSDGLYLLFYPGVAIAIGLMGRRRRPSFNRAGALDATIVASASGPSHGPSSSSRLPWERSRSSRTWSLLPTRWAISSCSA